MVGWVQVRGGDVAWREPVASIRGGSSALPCNEGRRVLVDTAVSWSGECRNRCRRRRGGRDERWTSGRSVWSSGSSSRFVRRRGRRVHQMMHEGCVQIPV